MNGNRESPGIRFGTRSLFVTLSVLAVLFAGYGCLYRRFIEPRRHSDSVERRLESLALRRPPDMSPRQWESAVAWTLNLHGNSLLFRTDAPTLREFDQRLAEKLRGEVTMDTIHRIWDEYAELCPGGARYQKFRSVMIEEIQGGGGNWNIRIP